MVQQLLAGQISPKREIIVVPPSGLFVDVSGWTIDTIMRPVEINLAGVYNSS
jgi:hypothetical protein